MTDNQSLLTSAATFLMACRFLSLEFGDSLELGAWDLELFPLPRLAGGSWRSPAFGNRKDRLDACAVAWTGIHFEGSAQDTHAFGDVFQPKTSSDRGRCRRARAEAAAIIFDPEPHVANVPFEDDPGAPGLGMFQDVVHGFLDDAI